MDYILPSDSTNVKSSMACLTLAFLWEFMMKKFGDKLRILRERRSLTLRELAEILEVHYTHLNKIELGRKRPSTELVLKISHLFNVTTDHLMKDELELDEDHVD